MDLKPTVPQPEPAPAAESPTQNRKTQVERRAASRGAILEAARAEFLEKGYANVSLGDIVRRAGKTRGALYHQFDDKACVFHEIIQAESASMQVRMAAALALIPDPLEKLRHGFGFYLDAVGDLRVLRLIHVDYPNLIGPSRWTLESPWLAYAENLLKDADARGLLRPCPIRAMSRLILAFYREAIVAIAYADDPAPIRAEMSAALDVLIDGMRTSPPPAR